MTSKNEALERHRKQVQEALRDRKNLREEAKDDAIDGIRELREYIEDEVGTTPWIEHVYQCIVLRIQRPHVALVEAGFFGGPINALFGDRKPLVGFKYELRYPSLGAVPWIKVPSAKFMYYTRGSSDRKTLRVMRISWPPLDPKGEPEQLCVYKGMQIVYRRADYLFNGLLGVDGNGTIWTTWLKNTDSPRGVISQLGITWWPGLGAGEESPVYWIPPGYSVGAVDSTQGQSKIAMVHGEGKSNDLEFSVHTHEEVNIADRITDPPIWSVHNDDYPIFYTYRSSGSFSFAVGELDKNGNFHIKDIPGSYDVVADDAVRYSYAGIVFDSPQHKLTMAVNNEPAEQLTYRSFGGKPHIWTETDPTGKEETRIAWPCRKYSQPNEVAGPSLGHYISMGTPNPATVHWVHHPITVEFPGLKDYKVPNDPLNCFMSIMSLGPNEEDKTLRFIGWWAPNQLQGHSGFYHVGEYAPKGDPRSSYLSVPPTAFGWDGDWGVMGGAIYTGPYNYTAPTGQQVLEVFIDGKFITQAPGQDPITRIVADSRDGLDLLCTTYSGQYLYSLDGGAVWFPVYKDHRIEDPGLYGMTYGNTATGFIVEL